MSEKQSEKDNLYQDPGIQAERFAFDRRVVRVFPDMIRRSVPGYGLIVPSIALLARRYAQPGTHLYDLGCSLGAASFAILDAVANRGNQLIAIDRSPEMVERFRALADERFETRPDEARIPLRIEEGDILDAPIENASLVVLNFTLQFIDPDLREGLLEKIAAGMRPGGALIVSEKIRFAHDDEQERQYAWHLDFKRAQGYSELEIARKRDALEETLRPDTLETHVERLNRAGFSGISRWFQCFNFASIVAFRSPRMDFAPYQALTCDGPWLEGACGAGRRRLAECGHGDLPRWLAALQRLPQGEPLAELDRPAPRFGKPDGNPEAVRDALMALHPWRKGPLEIHGVPIDAEWRSDLKWARIQPLVDLGGRRVLDIGCGNGYFGWRMLAAGADLVVGVDPTWVYVMQWLACRQASGDLPNFVLPLGVEDLPDGPADFDTVFSMGVLYHRREPLSHLERLRGLLRPGGELVLETLVLPEDRGGELLQPRRQNDGRYARMRNVWAIPGCERLLSWLDEAGFSRAEIADVSTTTPHEQRSTVWMTFESLVQALDPEDPELTVEGHPAPRRAVLIARR